MHNVFSRFHLTGIAFEYLLKLVSAHLPDSKHCVSSLYMLKKWCLQMFPGYKCTPVYYCLRCSAPVGESNHCRSCDGKSIGRFVIADITAQLKGKFKGECIPKNKQGLINLKDEYGLQVLHLDHG